MSIPVTVNREHKSTLFYYIFGSVENRHYLLSLYNAVNDTSYTNIEDIEINTIVDFIYIRMKNDVSFILDTDMSLYKHQSTYNPNMPIRGLMYFSTLYSQFLSEKNKNIYGKSLVKIPTPRYIVFYNGDDSYPDRLDLKLSDAFERPDSSGSFEWTATMLRFFKKHREGIMHSCLSEFNEEAFRKGIHDEGYIEAAIHSLHMLKDNNVTKDTAIAQLVKYFNLSKQDAISLVNEHWE